MKNKKNQKAKKPSKKALAIKKAQKHVKKLHKKIAAINKICKKTGKPVKIVIVNINKTKSPFLVNGIKSNLPKRTGSTISFHPLNKKEKALKERTKKISYIKKLKIKK